jgi:hypothetical protein
MFYAARLKRGNSAIGGEILIPMIPFIVYLFKSERTEKNDQV